METNNGYIFRNGSTIESLVGTAAHAWSGDRRNPVVVVDSILEIFTPEELLEWVIEDNKLVIRTKDVPDFGEFDPSNNMLEYIGGGMDARDIG